MGDSLREGRAQAIGQALALKRSKHQNLTDLKGRDRWLGEGEGREIGAALALKTALAMLGLRTWFVTVGIAAYRRALDALIYPTTFIGAVWSPFADPAVEALWVVVTFPNVATNVPRLFCFAQVSFQQC